MQTKDRLRASEEPICFEARIERIAPEVPRFVVYPGKAWDETGAFLVEVSLNAVPIGLRNLIPWKERGWHFGLSEPICRMVGLDTGDPVHVEIRRLGDKLPEELRDILKTNPQAKKAWNALPEGAKRDFIVFVANAKKVETRMRRASQLLTVRSSLGEKKLNEQ